MSEAVKPITSIIGGVTSALGLGKQATPVIKQADPVQTDDALNQADDLLRKRQRKGVNANMLSGQGGDNTVSASSTGQKTLLGG
ncbi:hypothetical protein SNN83_001518 [Cronobacter malonaticus]|nr:hypothetical protein [Cronobacter malonaticus]